LHSHVLIPQLRIGDIDFDMIREHFTMHLSTDCNGKCRHWPVSHNNSERRSSRFQPDRTRLKFPGASTSNTAKPNANFQSISTINLVDFSYLVAVRMSIVGRNRATDVHRGISGFCGRCHCGACGCSWRYCSCSSRSGCLSGSCGGCCGSWSRTRIGCWPITTLSALVPDQSWSTILQHWVSIDAPVVLLHKNYLIN